MTPVAEDCIGIAILSSSRAGLDSHFDAFGELRYRVNGHPHGQGRAAGPLRQNVRSRAAGRVLLAGDAAGYIDVLTGEGTDGPSCCRERGLPAHKTGVLRAGNPRSAEWRAWALTCRNTATREQMLGCARCVWRTMKCPAESR